MLFIILLGIFVSTTVSDAFLPHELDFCFPYDYGMASNNTRMPVVFLSHGGGPSFFMDAEHGPMASISRGSEAMKSLQRVPKQLNAEKPSAIVVVSGHWEGDQVQISAKESYSKLFYDYYGFPAHTYKLEYKAPAEPRLARTIHQMLSDSGIGSTLDTKRDWDHGVFIPLMVAFPNADIPVVEISILESYDPAAHLAIGKALAPLRDQGVLIVGSGFATHNFRPPSTEPMARFVRAVSDVVEKSTQDERVKVFEQWDKKLPGARVAHAQEDHFMPMFVVVGAASHEDVGKTLYTERAMDGMFYFAHWAFGPNL